MNKVLWAIFAAGIDGADDLHDRNVAEQPDAPAEATALTEEIGWPEIAAMAAIGATALAYCYYTQKCEEPEN